MNDVINVYCDESCHLEHDRQSAMVLGAIWCPYDLTKSISKELKNLKEKHGLSRWCETKWVKVSNSKLDYYKDVINFFFDNKDLHFRSVVIPDKSVLNHDFYSHDHDTWYYKMWFILLRQVLDPTLQYRIYIDIKDTRSQEKTQTLREVLCNAQYDFNYELVERIQQVHSREIEMMQIVDLLIGALSYLHRGLSSSESKLQLIDLINQRSGHDLLKNTLPREDKFNILVWRPKEL